MTVTVETKERPISFRKEMVQAILDGRKTQTRRFCKIAHPSHDDVAYGVFPARVFGWVAWFSPMVSGLRYADDKQGWIESARKRSLCYERGLACPYGKPGDRLWVKETYHSYVERIYSANGTREIDRVLYAADGGTLVNGAKWRSGRFMPRSGSRITLEITDIRCERLQDISEEDAKSEGVREDEWLGLGGGSASPARASFVRLWDSINLGSHPWAENPWVWVVSFRRVS